MEAEALPSVEEDHHPYEAAEEDHPCGVVVVVGLYPCAVVGVVRPSPSPSPCAVVVGVVLFPYVVEVVPDEVLRQSAAEGVLQSREEVAGQSRVLPMCGYR